MKNVVPALFLLLSPWLALGCNAAPESTIPRHIVLITIDTLRADYLGFHDYPRPTSPFLDGLAERSVVFERAYSSSSHTGPSHASLMTSLQPAQHRLLQNGERLNPKVRTLAAVLQEAGYRTAAFTVVSFLEGVSKGFQDFHPGKDILSAEEVLSSARAWIARQPPETPVFVWVHLFDVHEWHNDDFLDTEAVEAMRGEAPTGDDLLNFLVEEYGLPEKGLHREKVMDAIHRYDGQIRTTDRSLRRFYEQLGAGGFHDDALWIITADHGEGLGNHNAMGHGIHIYNEQLHVPLLMHAPEATDLLQRRVKQPVALVDVVPTITDWLGVEWSPHQADSQGRSLMPLLAGGKIDREDAPIFAQRRPMTDHQRQNGWEEGEVYALQSARRKLIVHLSRRHEYFDLVADPRELNNLFDLEKDEQSTLLRRTVRHYRQLIEGGEVIGSGEINEDYVEELEALGYL